MNRLKHFFCLITLFCSVLIVNGQLHDWQCHIINDPVPDPTRAPCPDVMTDPPISENGLHFTPRGNFNVLVIYAGFVGLASTNDRDLGGWDPVFGTGNEDMPDLPNYVNYDPITGQTITHDVFFNQVTDFDPGGPIDDPNNKSASRIWNTMSKPNQDFRLTGEVFSDPNGVPAMVVVDPYIDPFTGQMWTQPCDFPNSWQAMNRLVVQNASLMNPNYDWPHFDQRWDLPNYQCDNSVTPTPDGTIDYVIIIYKYFNNGNWDAADVQSLTALVGSNCNGNDVIEQTSWTGSGGGFNQVDLNSVDLPPAGSGQQLSFLCGSTIANGLGNHADVFLHEVAHTAYHCPHFFSANNVVGDYFNKHASGWGATAQRPAIFSCLTAWERWYLGYIDGIEVVQDGIFELEDFITSGDAIRLEIPNSGGQHLWIENHAGSHDLDNHPQSGRLKGPNTETLGNSPNGIYMYIENIAGDKATFGFNNVGINGANGMKFINASGNHDYKMDTTIGSATNFDGEVLHRTERKLANPISGGHPALHIRDDFDNDGIILHSQDWNGGGTQEHRKISREYVNSTDKYLYRNMFADSETISGYNDNPAAFQAGDIIGIGTNPTLFNYAKYNQVTGAFNPTFLNGLRIEILSIDNNGKATLDIKFEETTISQNLRWTGNIILPNITNNAGADLIIENSQLTLDMSKTVNRHTLHPTLGGFVNPSIMTIRSGAKLHMLENTNLTVQNGSTLIIEDGAEVLMEDGACIVIEEGAFLELKGNNIHLNGEKALISIRGTLKTEDDIDFTFTGNGYADFYQNHSLEMGQNSNFILHRDPADIGTKFLLLHENTTLAVNDRVLELRDGAVEYKEGSKMTANNTALTFWNTDFYGIDLLNPLPNAVEGENLTSCTMRYCKFENLDRAIYLLGTMAATPLVLTNEFTHCKTAIEASDMDEVSIEDNYFFEQELHSIKLENISVAHLNENSIIHLAYLGIGCELKNVNFAYFGNFAGIQYCETGILAEASNVFLSHGSTIFDCDIGVHFVNNTTAEYMLSVGRCKCGNIIDNNIGVKGDNIVLDIDVFNHQVECNAPSPSPNRFDGNGLVFDICYTDPGFPVLSTIMMRGNYWGGSALNNYAYNLRNGTGATGCSTNANMSVDDSNYLPGPYPPAPCHFIEAPYPQTPQYPATAINPVRCEFTKNGLIVEVHEQSRAAYEDLFNKDYTNARTKYTPVADLDRLNNPNPRCVNKINIARCMVEAIDNGDFAAPNSSWLGASLRSDPFLDGEIVVYPNPAKHLITIESKSEQAYLTRIYNIFGQAVDAFEFTRMETFDVQHLQSGVYLLEVIDLNGHPIQTKKLIIE